MVSRASWQYAGWPTDWLTDWVVMEDLWSSCQTMFQSSCTHTHRDAYAPMHRRWHKHTCVRTPHGCDTLPTNSCVPDWRVTSTVLTHSAAQGEHGSIKKYRAISPLIEMYVEKWVQGQLVFICRRSLGIAEHETLLLSLENSQIRLDQIRVCGCQWTLL